MRLVFRVALKPHPAGYRPLPLSAVSLRQERGEQGGITRGIAIGSSPSPFVEKGPGGEDLLENISKLEIFCSPDSGHDELLN